MGFNRKSFKKKFKRAFPKKGFVLLSHWDFDHYALALKEPALKKLDWYAPWQPVGPNITKFQHELGSRLRFISGEPINNALCKAGKSQNVGTNKLNGLSQLRILGMIRKTLVHDAKIMSEDTRIQRVGTLARLLFALCPSRR